MRNILMESAFLLLVIVVSGCNAFFPLHKNRNGMKSKRISRREHQIVPRMPSLMSYQDETSAPTPASSKQSFPGGTLHAFKQAFALSPNEISINMIQLAMLLTMCGLIRIPSVGNLSTKALQCFPHAFMPDYEHLSIVDWVIHYSGLAYNIGVMRGLLTTRNGDGSGSVSTRKRKLFAIAVTGVGHVLGISLLISHSLIGTGSPAAQAFYNFSAFWIKFSAMAVGGLLLLPTVGGIVSSLLVAYSIMKGLVTFQNVYGIVLSNIGLIAILASSKRTFPLKFKIGYTLMIFSPVVAINVDRILGGGTDLAHALVALWISVTTIILRWSLMDENADKTTHPQESKCQQQQQPRELREQSLQTGVVGVNGAVVHEPERGSKYQDR